MAEPAGADARLLKQMIAQFPECEPELRAFADIADLARLYGPDGWYFEQALLDLAGEIVDCAEAEGGHTVPIAGRPKQVRPLLSKVRRG